jgi:hypothetical protein
MMAGGGGSPRLYQNADFLLTADIGCVAKTSYSPQKTGLPSFPSACAAMYYGVFLTIVNITKAGCGCCFCKEKGPRKD